MTYASVRRHTCSTFLACLFACSAIGQQESAEPASPAKLEINLDARGGANISLKIPDRTLESPLTPVMDRVIGCRFDHPKDRDVDGDWIFSGRCDGVFRKRGLLVGGQFQFAPLMKVLEDAGAGKLDVTIRHPRTGFSRLTENGWALDTTPQSLEYTKSLTAGAGAVRLAFGYRVVNFLPISLLLFPVGLTMVMRWVALRARNTEPVIVWFSYWRLFGWIITGAWLLWVQGSTVLDCAALARFLMNESPQAPLLQIAFYLVPPVLVQLICTVASGAVLARVSGESWVLPVSLKHAFWHAPVTVWPLLGLLAGVACITLFNEVLLGLVCLGIAYLTHSLLVQLWLRFQNLGRYVLPAGDLRSRILDLSKKAGVKLREIYLLPAAEGRLAGPYMIRSHRLFLSDALLRGLQKRETEAVLTLEFAHLRRRHREIMAGSAIVALPLIYRFSHLPFVEGALPWAVRGPLLVWLTPMFLYLMWRRFTRSARAEAVAITRHADAMADGVSKIAQFNVLASSWQKLERRFLPNDKVRDGDRPLASLSIGGKQPPSLESLRAKT